MKHLFTIASILCVSLALSQNTSFPIPDSTYWRVDKNLNNSFQFPCFVKYYFQYFTKGDTMINQTGYKKVYKSYEYVHVYLWTLPVDPPESQPEYYAGALRDDLLSDKVYFVLPNTSVDSLLYDYNMEVGDTLKGYLDIFLNNELKPVVSSVDSVLINGQYRTRWNFPQCHNSDQYIVEGIGASSGLLEPLCTYNVDLTDKYLVCVGNEQGQLYSTGYVSELGCNEVNVGIPEWKSGKRAGFSPNPFTVETTMQVNFNLNDAILTLYDSQGNQARQITKLNGCSLTLQRNGLPSGIYFFRLAEGNLTIKSGKIIITDN